MIRPMLAKKAGAVPAGGYSFEIKWDGVRGLASIEGGRVTLHSRSGKSEFSQRFAAVAEQLAQLPDCLIDGELVKLDEAGFTNGLPAGMHPGEGSYVAFDVLEARGESVRHLPIEERRLVLDELLAEGGSTPAVSRSPVFEDGQKLLAWVAKNGLEGVVAKRDGSRYADGSRGEAWLKVKARNEQEFIVCGWTEGKNGRAGTVGSLVLGYWELWPDGARELVYAGRVGSRVADEAELREGLIPAESPFTRWLPAALRNTVHWAEPNLVIQVEFQCWTADGRLQHPIYKGIREDKRPDEVTREA
jgi:bifunctional non-homologous end joining protein LigD